jgi:HD superfamily phosphodiesterase
MVDKIKLEMINYFKDDVKQINHALKVYGFASTISGLEKLSLAEKNITELAAVLHDIGIEEAERKHNPRAGHFQEIEGPPIAREILKRNGFAEEVIERVCFLIGNHHSYDKIDGLDFRILVESDFIVNISEGSMNKPAIEQIAKNYFVTTTGREILQNMYLL